LGSEFSQNQAREQKVERRLHQGKASWQGKALEGKYPNWARFNPTNEHGWKIGSLSAEAKTKLARLTDHDMEGIEQRVVYTYPPWKHPSDVNLKTGVGMSKGRTVLATKQDIEGNRHKTLAYPTYAIVDHLGFTDASKMYYAPDNTLYNWWCKNVSNHAVAADQQSRALGVTTGDYTGCKAGHTQPYSLAPITTGKVSPCQGPLWESLFVEHDGGGNILHTYLKHSSTLLWHGRAEYVLPKVATAPHHPRRLLE
jgi:hypothetical protein